ncbi:hypothetical protein AMTRI_Chr04g188410 [Amborella trichopoda]
MRRGDVTCQYGTKMNDKGRVRRNFCNKEMGGGIYHIKEHLSWLKGNVTSSRKMISMYWYTNALLFNYASSDFYPQMVASITEAELGVRGLTTKELAGSCLKVVVHDVDKHIAQFKVCWLGTRVIIMTDGWKDKSHRYLINFLIGSLRGIIYHSSIDLSKKTHTRRLICLHLDKIEIGKLKRVKYCILKSKLIIRFIYNHTYLHALMREPCMREIVRESHTRFATTFLTIQSILVNNAGVRSMICSNECQTDRAAISQLGRHMLRLSDSDDKPAMGFLFDAMRRAREAIFENNIWNEEILEIVDRREKLYNKPCAEFFLNPQNLYSNATLDDANIIEGIAVRILSQTCAASGCERNWSTFQWIHTLRRNRLKTHMLHNLVSVHYNLKLREKHIRRTPINYTPINLDYIFRRDFVDKWVSLRTPLLDHDFFSGAVVNMDDNVNVAAFNEGDMTMDMDDDYTLNEDEAHDDEKNGTIENN